MESFFLYILKSSLCLMIYYIIYKLFYGKETFYRLNRFVILFFLSSSVILPAFKISFPSSIGVQNTIISVRELLPVSLTLSSAMNTVTIADNTPFIIGKLLLLIYLIGVTVLISKIFLSVSRLIKIIINNRKENLTEQFILIRHHEKISPFSWIRYIFISEKDYCEDVKEILIHETAHLKAKHSRDLIIAEFICIYQWFNPFAWLLKQELKNLHEFEADKEVLDKGINIEKYQMLLIKKAVGTRLYSMANSFNHSQLKKRITMMLKKKSNPWARLKYLCILPVAALVVTGFARPELSYELNKFQNDEINDFTALVKTNLEKFEPIEKSGSPSSRKHIKEKRTIASETATDTSNITIIRLSDNSPEKQPLVIFDDKEIPYSSIKKLNQEKIQSISVIKDKTGVDLYGEKAKNGVIIIRMKKDTASITPGEKLKLKVSPIRNSNLLDKTLFFLDGKEISKSDFEKLRQDRIESLEILNNAQEFEEKNPTLYNKYKYKLKNNVIIIISKKYKPEE